MQSYLQVKEIASEKQVVGLWLDDFSLNIILT